MLSRPEFIRQSLELHLFFARNLKEHLLFRNAGNGRGMQVPDDLETKFDNLLTEAVSLSKGSLGYERPAFDEFITKYTLEAELSAAAFSGIAVDASLTESEYSLPGEINIIGNPMLEDKVRTLNDEAVYLANMVMQSKRELGEQLSTDMKVMERNNHKVNKNIIKEAEFYLRAIQRLQDCEEAYKAKDSGNIQTIWNDIMANHATILKEVSAGPSNGMSEQFERFESNFEELKGDIQKAADFAISKLVLIKKSMQVCSEFKDLLWELVQDLSWHEKKASIMPLVADHMLREACFYLKLLKEMNLRITG